jgi:biotin transport system substrate-specific component
MSSTALVPTLVRPNNRVAALVADAVLVGLGVTLLALTAQISIPLPNTPVPLTGQTFGVLLIGGAYGATRGFVTMATYLVVGGLGYGVFAQHGSGWDTLKFTTASGGYLVGMLVAAGFVGWMADRGWDRKVWRSLPTMVLGNVIIYAFGVTWLAYGFAPEVLGQHLTLSQAWNAGIKDFLVGDAIKILLAAGLLPAAWKLVDAVRR